MLLSADPYAVFDSLPPSNQGGVEVDLFVENVVSKLADLPVEYVAEQDRVVQREESFYVVGAGGDDIRTVALCRAPSEIVPRQTTLDRVTNDSEQGRARKMPASICYADMSRDDSMTTKRLNLAGRHK